MKAEDVLRSFGYHQTEDYYYDASHHSSVFFSADTCVILDYDLCDVSSEKVFDYSKYCEMQNKWMAQADKLYRFYVTEETPEEIRTWLTSDPDSIEVNDNGGSFDRAHVDNTPLEKEFEDLFMEAYGNDAVSYLQKEYSLSLSSSRNAFVDYVIETQQGQYAIEANGVHYHHPQLIHEEAYRRQLEKQNTLSLYGFKTYRFSIENISFKDQAIDALYTYLGDRNTFRNAHTIRAARPFALYTHQETILHDLSDARENGIDTSLIVCPTGSGKSQIGIEDIHALYEAGKIRNALIMVPTKAIREDWQKRLDVFHGSIPIAVELYNRTFLSRHDLAPEHYDYILFDEAQHAQAANCAKTLQYFTPKYLVGLTATPERLDRKKLEDIFGQYKTQMTLKDAIDKDVISNIRCYRLLSNIDLSSVRYNGKDYNYADLEKTLIVDSRNELIVRTLKKYFFPREGFYKQGIVFCVNVNHAKKLEKMMTAAGFTARAVYGNNTHNDEIFEQYRSREIQFLLSCQLISEGWDSPQTEITVMARPTLSKVLYTQQMGRGVRKYPGKECLYVIDVVDNYEGKLTPVCFNSLMQIPVYSDFFGVKNNSSDYLEILGLHESEIAMQEVDIFTFEEKYKDYLSPEQAARELFIGTSSLMSWYRKDNTISSLQLPIGSRMVPYFSHNDIERIREEHVLGVHDDTTLLKDFEDFIDENTLTFSFKLIFMLGMLKLADKEGEVSIDSLMEYYRDFYMDRIDRNLPVDRPNCIYTREYLQDAKKLKTSILSNPFEKFERKRFVYYSRDLNLLSFHPVLWSQLTDEKKDEIRTKEENFLQAYYEKLGGL
ncbi:MAG: DEAD/DEAH box helicase [Solobacterium sp.]|nr:DEAD/DEAH box helicase [Solobacterium sp.]